MLLYIDDYEFDDGDHDGSLKNPVGWPLPIRVENRRNFARLPTRSRLDHCTSKIIFLRSSVCLFGGFTASVVDYDALCRSTLQVMSN